MSERINLFRGMGNALREQPYPNTAARRHRARAAGPDGALAAFDAALGVLSLLFGGGLLAHVGRVRRPLGGVADGHADADLIRVSVSGHRMLGAIGRDVMAGMDRKLGGRGGDGGGLTSDSSALFELSTRSSSKRITPGSKRSRIVLPPNLKYPSSSARLTRSPGERVMTVLPTIMAPTQMTMTRPCATESIGTMIRTFSP